MTTQAQMINNAYHNGFNEGIESIKGDIDELIDKLNWKMIEELTNGELKKFLKDYLLK